MIKHEEAGWTVRRKGLDSFEGSVTVGSAVVGSSILVDE